MSSRPVVVIFNSNDDVVEMLRFAFERAGLVVVSGHIDAVRRGHQRLSDFVQEHNPSVIVYDLVPPYDRSWTFLEHLRETPSLKGRRFVITSTNARRVPKSLGAPNTCSRSRGSRTTSTQSLRRWRPPRAGATPSCRLTPGQSEGVYSAEPTKVRFRKW